VAPIPQLRKTRASSKTDTAASLFSDILLRAISYSPASHRIPRIVADFVRPRLTVIDCYRILARNGPTGGNLDDVLLKKTLVASTDPVAVDAYVGKAYWNLDVHALPYLKLAAKRGLGTYEFERVRTRIKTL